jgi:hypothetical protein
LLAWLLSSDRSEDRAANRKGKTTEANRRPNTSSQAMKAVPAGKQECVRWTFLERPRKSAKVVAFEW